MKRNLLFLFIMSFFLAACLARNEAAAVGSVYTDDVAAALQQRATNKKLAILVFESGATAQTCDEYMRLIAVTTLKEGVNNQLAKGEYLLCEVLAIVGDKKLSPGRQDVGYGQILATRLDLRSFPSSLFQMLDEKKYSLSLLDAKSLKVLPTVVTYETADWRYSLKLVATLDVNNNGKTDWVLWLADEAKSGNYRQYQTLIIYDVGDTGKLTAVTFEATLKNTQYQQH